MIEERIAVGKRQVERGGVRVQQHVTERPVEESVTLREEHVHVERRPVNQPVDATNMGAFKEGVIEVTEMAEEAVVSKQARVVEEVVIGKEVTEHQETIRDTVRRTDVELEQLDTNTSTETNKRGRQN
ncbi:MAG: YsnF/AvaK domain-containing protein [Pyrinomonadaceae bacterium]